MLPENFFSLLFGNPHRWLPIRQLGQESSEVAVELLEVVHLALTLDCAFWCLRNYADYCLSQHSLSSLNQFDGVIVDKLTKLGLIISHFEQILSIMA